MVTINDDKDNNDTLVDTNVWITTLDNPFNPFTQYDQWFAFDSDKGYNTQSFLARIVKTSDELSEADQQQALIDGVDQIANENVLGIYLKVTPSSFEDRSKTFNLNTEE